MELSIEEEVYENVEFTKLESIKKKKSGEIYYPLLFELSYHKSDISLMHFFKSIQGPHDLLERAVVIFPF